MALYWIVSAGKSLCTLGLIYIIASFCCVYVKSIDALILLRFIQAIGSCAAAVASIAMVRDLFPVKDNAKVFALLMLVVAVSPMIAPTVGGYATSHFGWHSVFIILMLLGVLNLLASIFGLPDSYVPDHTLSLKPRPILNNFLGVIKEPQFYTYALTGAMAFAGLFAYVAGSPLLFMDIFALSEENYGWIFAFLSIGLIGASQVNTLMLRKYTSEQLIFGALICQVITGIVFVIGSMNGWLGLPQTIFLLFVFLSCLGFASPNASALSLAPFTRNAGSASALMGAIQMGLGTLASIGVSLFTARSSVPMVSIMASTSLIALIILLTGRKMIKNKVEVDKENAGVSFH